MKWLVALAVLGGCDLVYSLDRPVSGWAEVEPGLDQACGRTRDRALFCWGGNLHGQVGTGDELVMIDTPTLVDGTWTRIAVAVSHTCAIRNDDSLWCWGNNGSGMLGTDATTGTRIPKHVEGTWRDVATGFFTTCALDEDRHLWCWGHGTAGQIGDGETSSRPTPVQIGDAAWLQVATAGLHTCGLQEDHTLWCWGDGENAWLGDPALDTITPSPAPIGTATWSSISAHIDGMCGLTTEGRLRCWGGNEWRQLGLGDEMFAATPTAVTIDDVDVDDWESIDGGYFTTCGIRASGEAWCWGDNQRGAIGEGPLSFARPVRIEHPAGLGWTSARAGTVNACFVDEEFRAWCAGANGQAQLGDGGTSPRTPARIDEVATASIDAGDRITCAIRGTELVCAGSGNNGQLGDDNPFARQTFAPVSGAWNAVTSGADHQCALDMTGKAFCWGDDFFTALGNGPGRMNATTPVEVAVPGPRSFVAIDAGTSHTCAIGTGGAITCWGYGVNGQIGDNSNANAEVPRVVTGGTNWAHVSAGGGHTCAIDVLGKVLCWGQNGQGELGDGSTTDRAMPVPLRAAGLAAPPLPAFTAVASGAEHTCAVGVDETMWCWGTNLRGQLAVSTGFATNTAAAIALAETGWRSVSAGAAHTCAIKTDNTLWCWGANERGQLGDGSLTDRRTPTRIDGENWTSVTCGLDHTCGIRDGHAYCWGNNDEGTTATGDAWTSTLTEIKEPDR